MKSDAFLLLPPSSLYSLLLVLRRVELELNNQMNRLPTLESEAKIEPTFSDPNIEKFINVACGVYCSTCLNTS